MAFTSVYNGNIRGKIVFTGNTLGVSPNFGDNPNRAGYIGAFLTTSTGITPPTGFPVGTTSNYQQNSSSAQLLIPTGATIESAYLIWAGNSGIGLDSDVPQILSDAVINAAILFRTPNGDIAGTENAVTIRSLNGNGQQFYVRYLDVTQSMISQPKGVQTYTVGRVPAILSSNQALTNDTNFAGWTLAIVYRKIDEPLRKIILNVGNEILTSGGPGVSINVTNIATPFSGTFTSRILLSAGEGDAILTGDTAAFAPTAAEVTNPVYQLSGPNNPAGNFFCSQINDSNGNLDQTGTWGTINHTVIPTVVPRIYARQGWDITNVPAVMNNDQRQGILRITTVGDTFMPIAIGLQIDIQSITMGLQKYVYDANNNPVTSRNVEPGQQVTYLLRVTNPDPVVDLTNVLLQDPLAPGIVFNTGTVTVGGQSRPLDNIVSPGVTIATLPAGQSIDVTFRATVQNISQISTVVNQSTGTYNYEPASGVIVTGDKVQSNTVTLNVLKRNITLTKTVNPTGNVVPGQILTYIVQLNNRSNYAINDAVITDTVPTGTTLLGPFPFPVNVGTLAAGASSQQYSFQVTVNENAPSIIANSALANFTYDGGKPDSEQSPIVTNPVIKPQLKVVKSQSTNFAVQDDTVTYTFNVTNSGQVAVSNLALRDLIPVSWTIVPNTLTITKGGTVTTVSAANLRDNAGAPLGQTLSPGESLTITFSVQIADVRMLPFSNKGTILYSYGPANLSGSQDSNIVILYYIDKPLTFTKTVNPAGLPAAGGEVIYTIGIVSTGAAQNVVINDVAPFVEANPADKMTFVAGSGTITPSTIPGTVTIDVAAGTVTVNIPNIPANNTVLVSFKAMAGALPGAQQRIYRNNASYAYTFFKEHGSTVPTNVTGTIRPAFVVQSQADVTINKGIYLVEQGKLPDNYAQINKAFNGETVQMRIAVTSNEVDPISSFRIGDVAETGLYFVSGTIEVFKNGALLTVNTDYTIETPGTPPIGFEDYDVLVQLTAPVNQNDVVELRFNSAVDTPTDVLFNRGISTFIRTGQTAPDVVITPKVLLYITSPGIMAEKAATPTTVQVGNDVLYTIMVSNTGNVQLNDIMLSDTQLQAYVAAGALIISSITVGGINVGTSLPVNMGDINPFENEIVTIRAQVNEVPTGNIFTNMANVTAAPVDLAREGVDPFNNIETPTDNTNEVQVKVIEINVTVTKTANRVEVENGEYIQYTLTVTNSSNESVENVTVYDILPDQTNFVPGSVRVNNVPITTANIRNGINIGTLGAEGSTPPPASQSVITYWAKVVLDDSLVPVDVLQNRAWAEYQYVDPSSGNMIDGRTDFTSVDVLVARPNLTAVKAPDNLYVVEGDVIPYVVTLQNTGDKVLTPVVIQDNLPSGLEQIVDVNLTTAAGALIQTFTNVNLANGLQIIGTGLSKINLQPQETVLVQFSPTVETVNNVTPQEEFLNNATITYYYTIETATDPVTRFKTVTTNTVVATGISQSVSVVKSVLPTSVQEGGSALYTLTLTNTGNTNIQNINLQDDLDPVLTLPWNYTLVNNAQVPGRITDAAGITIAGPVAPGEIVLIQFEAIYTTVPPTSVVNTADYSYDYVKDPEELPVPVGPFPTNPVTLTAEAENPNLSIVKNSPDQTVLAGETVTYDFVVSNDGNTPLTDIIFKDTLPLGMTYVQNSFFVNGAVVAGANPELGVNIGDLAVGASPIIVSFQARATNPPASGIFDNVATADYNYMRHETIQTGSATSNIYRITLAQISLVRTQSKNIVKVGDQITHTLTVTNDGASLLNNIRLTDIVDSRLTVDPSTITVNGVGGVSSLSNIILPDLQPGDTATIVYTGTVNSEGDGSDLVNTATVNGQTVDAKTVTDSASISTALVVVVDVTVAKTADKVEVENGEYIEYTLTVTNNSDKSIQNVTVYDILPDQTNFVLGSVRVNYVPVIAANIREGINIGTLDPQGSTPPPGNQSVITYLAKVTLDDSGTPVEVLQNKARAQYQYVIPGSGDVRNGITDFTSVDVLVARPNLTAVKAPEQLYVTQGDLIPYVITLQNTGDKVLTPIVIQDTLPSGLQQIVDVNLTNSVGTVIQAFKNVNLANGLQVIGNGLNKTNLQPQEIVLIQFAPTVQVVNNVVPSQEFLNTANITYYYTIETPRGPITRFKNTETNTVVAIGINPSLSVVKSVSPTIVAAGGTALYTLTLRNTGNTNIQNINLQDDLDSVLRLPWDYTLVDNVQVPGRVTDAQGIRIAGPIAPNSIVLVQFEAIYTTVPPTSVVNTADYSYDYIKDPNELPVPTGPFPTNPVTLTGEQQEPLLSIVKNSPDKTVLVQGTVTYNFAVSNDGNTPLTDIIFKDTLPLGMTYVQNSFFVNGALVVGANPVTGVNIGDLAAEASPIIVSFQATAASTPTSGIFDNVATADYSYVNISGIQTGNATSNVYRITLAQISLVRTQSQSTAWVGDKVTHTLTVTNNGASPLSSILLSDIVDSRLTVDPSTITVNGVGGIGSLTNIALPDLQPGGTATIVYTGTVNSAGDGSDLVNTATVNGQTVDIKTVTDSASISTTLVASPITGTSAVKTVSRPWAQVGDELTYQIILTNTSSSSFTGATLQDIVDSNLQVIGGAITVNGQPVSGSLSNLNLGQLAANSTTVISFRVRVVSIPQSGVVTDVATVILTDSSGTQTSITSNTVQTVVIDNCRCFYTPISLSIPVYGNISRVTSSDAQLLRLNSTSNACGTVLALNYAVQINYQDRCGMPQSYTTTGVTYVQVQGLYTGQTITLLTDQLCISKTGMIQGNLIIRLC